MLLSSNCYIRVPFSPTLYTRYHLWGGCGGWGDLKLAYCLPYYMI